MNKRKRKPGLKFNPGLVYGLMIGCSKMDREMFRENALEQKKKKRGLKFNLGLVLIGLQTTEPRGKLNKTFHVWQLPQKVEFKTTFKRISLHE